MSPLPLSLGVPGRYGYRYSSDDQYFDPITSAQKRSFKDTNEILQDESTFWPKEGQSWCSIRQLLDHHQDGDTKLFFVARHGHSEHNKTQETYGIDCFNAASEVNQALHNPGLTAEGQAQSRKLGQLLRTALLDDLGVEPQDVSFYSSSLNRCISTAEIAASAIFQHQEQNTVGKGATATHGATAHYPQGSRPALVVLDELREWLGWDHNAGSDRRGSKAEITHAFRDSHVDLVFKRDFPEDDIMMRQGDTVRETWVDVRKRWERALDWIYENDARKYICLFGNNRSLQCGLHVLGLPLDAGLVDKHKKITVVNMANCAMVALIVRRQALSGPEEVYEKEIRWAELELKEQDVIQALRMKEKAAKENAGADSRRGLGTVT